MQHTEVLMGKFDFKHFAIVLAHGFVGWVLCMATMELGMQITSQNNAFMIHLIAAPIFFLGLSLFYFTRFNYTTPFQTAAVFTITVVVLDFVVMAGLVLRSVDMFFSPGSIVGTWLPLTLIFVSTYLTGITLHRSPRSSIPVNR